MSYLCGYGSLQSVKLIYIPDKKFYKQDGVRLLDFYLHFILRVCGLGACAKYLCINSFEIFTGEPSLRVIHSVFLWLQGSGECKNVWSHWVQQTDRVISGPCAQSLFAS